VLKEAAVLLCGEDGRTTAGVTDVIARGFDEPGRLRGKSAAERRMLSRPGNPQARNLLEVMRALQDRERVQVEVRFPEGHVPGRIQPLPSQKGS
jgi:hypothetical protein